MQTGILRVLRRAAASWWRYKDLRRTEQTDLARQLERQTIRRDLAYLRQAESVPNAHVICGEGGTYIHLGTTTVSSFAPIQRFPLAALAVARGTLLIDIRPVTDTLGFARLPRVTREDLDGLDQPAAKGSVPLTSHLDLVAALGARILNDPHGRSAA